jgi:hypothetical protein
MPKRRTRLPPSVEQAQGQARKRGWPTCFAVCGPFRIAPALLLQIIEADMAEMRGKAGDRIPDLAGRFALVTGANSGIGFETARALARHRAETVLACHDLDKAATAVARIRAEIPEAKLHSLSPDLADLDAVTMGAAIYARTYSRAITPRTLGSVVFRRWWFSPTLRLSPPDLGAYPQGTSWAKPACLSLFHSVIA